METELQLGDLKQSFELFELIGSTTSRTRKEEYLIQGKENPIFKNLLYLTYNPFLIFGIKKDPKVKPEGEAIALSSFINFKLMTGELASRKLTDNAAKDAVAEFFRSLTELEYKWYMKVLKRDLKIGITEKTINSIFEGLIPVFTCMLAEKIRKNSFPDRFIVDTKLDGYRCLAFHHLNGNVELRSRNGKEISGYNDLEEAIKLLPRGFIYDGEILGRSNTFNEVQKSAFKKSTGKDGVLHIFDMVLIEEFESDGFVADYDERLFGLNSITITEIIENSGHLSRVDYWGPFTNSEEDIKKVKEIHLQNVGNGLEGTMVKDLSATYKKGKGRAIQKIKEFDTIDLTVVGVEEGKEGTRNEGRLGALVVEYKGNTVNVGTGFSDQLREELWSSKEDLINRTIEVEFFEESQDEDGKQSLRFPVFKRFRDDK